jgi:alpha-D-ribose 1-methylphosphonate 5-triphosphate diphosphatase PhnM
VRGESHSGNASTRDLGAKACSSDYVPAALLQAAFTLDDTLGFAPPTAVATGRRTAVAPAQYGPAPCSR